MIVLDSKSRLLAKMNGRFSLEVVSTKNAVIFSVLEESLHSPISNIKPNPDSILRPFHLFFKDKFENFIKLKFSAKVKDVVITKEIDLAEPSYSRFHLRIKNWIKFYFIVLISNIKRVFAVSRDFFD